MFTSSPDLSTPILTSSSSGSVIDPAILAESAVLELCPVFQAERLAAQRLVHPLGWDSLLPAAPAINTTNTTNTINTINTTNTPSTSLSGLSRRPRGDLVHGCILCPHRDFDRRSDVLKHVMRKHLGYGENNWRDLLEENKGMKWRS